MLTIKQFVFNSFQENTFVLYDQTGQCIIVDAGCYETAEKEELVKFLLDHKLKCIKLVNTHCHVDHVLGNAFITSKYNPEIIIHKNDEFLIPEARKHGVIFGFNVEEPPHPTAFVSDGSTITFGESSLEVYHVPGHSPGSIALYSPEQKFVIAGDVLFKGSIGRTDLPGGDYDLLINSILKKLMTLPPETIVYPGHGPSTTIHEEALSNPFLE
jgi:glyoxylase-like metal-dependent hydrolase (beta-lactamase superfamily II)